MNRTNQMELLDQPDIPYADIQQNLKELDLINRFLGGHSITIQGLKLLIKVIKQPLHICEIGCGGGDNIRALSTWCQRHHLKAKFTGIDIKETCIRYAEGNLSQQAAEITLIHNDYRKVLFTEKPDIIFSSLFCHHFEDSDVIELLKWKSKNSQIGFFINDLHRHSVAYTAIRWLSKWFSRSYLLKHDAPLSVKRGMTRTEWEHLMKAAGIRSAAIHWKWAFRWLICVKK